MGELLSNLWTILLYMGAIAAVTTAPLLLWFVWVWVFRDRRS